MRTCLRKLVNVAESKESELNIKNAIELMEERGYITKEDFIL